MQQAVPGSSRKGRSKPVGQRIGQGRRVWFRADLEMPLGGQLYGEGHATRLPGMRETLFILISSFTLSLDLLDHPVKIALEQTILHDAVLLEFAFSVDPGDFRRDLADIL